MSEDVLCKLKLAGFKEQVFMLNPLYVQYILDAKSQCQWRGHSNDGFAFPILSLRGVGYVGIKTDDSVLLVSKMHARNFVAKNATFMVGSDYVIIPKDIFKKIPFSK